ncbi:TetR/AcrR family transcriptional regulator C-terminal ligand-binding domain-containing protein [Nocardia sp. NPDC059177]|uniref:TetR/AcrR family transcriptional regulator n=1 Tax=Nocardia sp. NPDC059177 TaxID=3346759 RepID=UPI003685BF0D
MTQGRRGAVRSEAARISILQATAAQFAARGWDHLAIEGIAAAAGVSKQTIYRWWPSKAGLVADCLLEGLLLPESFVPADTGDLRADLTAWLTTVFVFADEPGNAVLFRSLVAAAAEDEQVGLQVRDALGASSALQARLETARALGELDADAPLQQISDALVGVIVLHVITRASTAPELPGRLVHAVTGSHRSPRG